MPVEAMSGLLTCPFLIYANWTEQLIEQKLEFHFTRSSSWGIASDFVQMLVFWRALLDIASTHERHLSLQVGNGTVEFTPTPSESRQLIAAQYRVPQTLLVQFQDDNTDETNQMAPVLKRKFSQGTDLSPEMGYLLLCVLIRYSSMVHAYMSLNGKAHSTSA